MKEEKKSAVELMKETIDMTLKLQESFTAPFFLDPQEEKELKEYFTVEKLEEGYRFSKKESS